MHNAMIWQIKINCYSMLGGTYVDVMVPMHFLYCSCGNHSYDAMVPGNVYTDMNGTLGKNDYCTHSDQTAKGRWSFCLMGGAYHTNGWNQWTELVMCMCY